ncbi:MAG: hypothetical protein Q7R76_04620 [Candidatus Woesearchaeota archaeon]|nr:hypothetical protein [Candidatus Woesearchaeota archaeon]
MPHNNIYKVTALFFSTKKGETIPDIPIPETALASPQMYNRVLAVVNDATHTLTTRPLTTVASLKIAYDVYERAKAAMETLPHSNGRAIAQERLMFLYRYITDSRRLLISDDFNNKTEFIVNLIDKATHCIEENKPDDASQLYSKAQELFSALPDEPTLLHKKENTRKHLGELHERIVHRKEIEQDQRFYRTFHSVEMLLDRASTLAKKDSVGARKTYDDALKVYRSLNVPAAFVWKKAAVRKRIHAVEAQLKPSKKEFYAPLEHTLSHELVELIAGDHSLKSQAGFSEMVKLLTELDSCSVAHIGEARELFTSAKKKAASFTGDKRALNACFAKIRARLELFSTLEKIQHVRSAGEVHTLLAETQRRSLVYNQRYPHDHACTDAVYEECALLNSLMEEGVTAGEVARAVSHS